MTPDSVIIPEYRGSTSCPHVDRSTKLLDEEQSQVSDTRRVPVPEWTHVHDLPVEELHPGTGGEHARLVHAAVVVHREEVAAGGSCGSGGNAHGLIVTEGESYRLRHAKEAGSGDQSEPLDAGSTES